MEFLKDDKTVQLDEVTRTADETLAFYDDLIDSIEDTRLREDIARHVREQSEILRSLFLARQAHDELPQAGDEERGHWSALMTSIRQYLANDDAPVIEKLLAANSDMRQRANSAMHENLPREERSLIERLIESCDSLDARLQRQANQARDINGSKNA